MKKNRKSIVISSFILLDCLFAGVVVSGKAMGKTAGSIAQLNKTTGTGIVEKLSVMEDDATETMEYNTVSQEDILIAQEIMLNEQGDSVKVQETATPLKTVTTDVNKITSNIAVSNSNKLAKQKKKEKELAISISNNAGSELGVAIAKYSLQFNGNPYVYGGTSLTKGADCSGFIQSIFKNFGINLPRTARAQAAIGYEVSIKDIQAGDLVFYSDGGPSITHVALYIGNGKIIHARTPAHGIGINSVFIMKRISIRRVI